MVSPNAGPNSYFDDITQTARSSDVREVETEMCQAAGFLARGLLGQGHKISEKTVAVGSKHNLARNLVAKMEGLGVKISAAKYARDLGIDTGVGARRIRSLPACTSSPH